MVGAEGSGRFLLRQAGSTAQRFLTMPGVPEDPTDFTKPINFRPRDQDPEVLRELFESTKLRGAQLIRHALAELLRRDRARRAREKATVGS